MIKKEHETYDGCEKWHNAHIKPMESKKQNRLQRLEIAKKI